MPGIESINIWFCNSAKQTKLLVTTLNIQEFGANGATWSELTQAWCSSDRHKYSPWCWTDRGCHIDRHKGCHIDRRHRWTGPGTVPTAGGGNRTLTASEMDPRVTFGISTPKFAFAIIITNCKYIRTRNMTSQRRDPGCLNEGIQIPIAKVPEIE